MCLFVLFLEPTSNFSKCYHVFVSKIKENSYLPNFGSSSLACFFLVFSQIAIMIPVCPTQQQHRSTITAKIKMAAIAIPIIAPLLITASFVLQIGISEPREKSLSITFFRPFVTKKYYCQILGCLFGVQLYKKSKKSP